MEQLEPPEPNLDAHFFSTPIVHELIKKLLAEPDNFLDETEHGKES